MFFDLEDYASTYRNTVSPGCIDPTEPKVDNSSIECDSIVSTNCVVTAKGYPYLGIGYQETLTSVIEKIKEKFKSISFTILNLGSGIGLLKSFSGGVLSAKSIKAGNNIVITDANDTLTINAIGGGSGGGVIDITHADLVTAKNASTLVPGTYYRITDFRTMYDQPDYDSAGAPKTSVAAKQGPVEPIIVLALKNNTLSTKAYQEAYPKDSIEYILEFTTPVNQTFTKGRIIYRKDEWNNETDFDHRNVLFKRYSSPLSPNTNGSFSDTGLPSVEYKFVTQTSTNKSVNNKSLGYFSRFLDSSNSLVFDLPNIVLSPQSLIGKFNDVTFDSKCYNVTVLDCNSSSFKWCINSLFEIHVENSTVNNVFGSELYRVVTNANVYRIHKSEIGGIYSSIIRVNSIFSSYLVCSNVYIGSFTLNDSISRIADYGQPPTNSFPTSNVTILSSNILSINDCNGSFKLENTRLNTILTTTFLSNEFVNVSGNNFSSNVMKQGEIIKHLNILGDVSNVNFSASTIIYDTTLSKEIIQHPNGLYIKHYDQFGASVINNVNA